MARLAPTLSVSTWMRAVRVRFLLSSVIAVALGYSAAWHNTGLISPVDAVVTALGVLALHASVDLLNDYRDYRRGIDQRTRRTGMSGGTGVLPEGLLEPESVRRAGLACLCAGSAIGSYYIYVHGMVIGLILGFAVVSIYFYSTRIVDAGLGEVFVGMKGALIVMGSYYIQAGYLGYDAVLAGAAAGSLSALVLYVTSFPDHDADKAGGRRTLVIICGPRRAARLYWAFLAWFAAAVVVGIHQGMFPAHAAASLAALPLAISAGRGLAAHHSNVELLLPYMRRTLVYARVAGIALVLGLLPPLTAAISWGA